MSKLMQKIRTTYTKNKRLLAILGSIVFLIVFFLYNNQNNEQEQQIGNATPTPATKIIDNSQTVPVTGNDTEAYFINQIVSNLTPVTGYSWKADKLLYSTPKGIYEAGTNKIVVQQTISNIYWANNFNALIKNAGVWYKLNFDNKSLDNLSLVLNTPIINDIGDKILDYQDKELRLYSLISSQVKSKTFEESIENVFFVNTTNEVIVSTIASGITRIYKLDENLTITNSRVFTKDYRLSAVSPDGKTLALTFNNELVLGGFDKNSSIDTFLIGSALAAQFRNNNELVVIEKYKDKLRRTLDNVYLTNVSANRFKITDSKPMINRIDTSLTIAFNGSSAVATFIENKAKIWIVSLKTNAFPTYSLEGELVFSSIEPKGI